MVSRLSLRPLCLVLALACHHTPPTPPAPPAPPPQTQTPSDTAPQRRARQATGGLSAAQRDTIIAEVRARRAAWQARRITDYRIRIAVECFCPSSAPRVLEVRGGKAVALLDTLGRPAGPLREPWSRYTVEELFDYVAQAARSVDVLAVRYDPRFGYPTEIRGDRKLGRYDDWFGVQATGLTPR